MSTLRWKLGGVGLCVLTAAACSRGPKPVAAIPVDPRCAAISDTLSKYVSTDALPTATFTGDTRDLRSRAPATAVSVDFVVRPDGTADPETVDVIGGSNSGFDQAVAQFVASNRFVPGQTNGCPVLSRFTLVLR
jgi:hypothetical protein